LARFGFIWPCKPKSRKYKGKICFAMAKNQLVTHKFLDYAQLHHKPNLSSSSRPPSKTKEFVEKIGIYKGTHLHTKQAGAREVKCINLRERVCVADM